MSTHQIELDEAIASDALQAAASEGVSLQDWVKETLRARLVTEQEAAEYFRQRRARATGEGFRQFLDQVPDTPPHPGDTWDNLQDSRSTTCP